jgi:hypothetical protein
MKFLIFIVITSLLNLSSYAEDDVNGLYPVISWGGDGTNPRILYNGEVIEVVIFFKSKEDNWAFAALSSGIVSHNIIYKGGTGFFILGNVIGKEVQVTRWFIKEPFIEPNSEVEGIYDPKLSKRRVILEKTDFAKTAFVNGKEEPMPNNFNPSRYSSSYSVPQK